MTGVQTCALPISIRQLNGLTQGYGPVEDYIIAFKALVPLSGFNDYALVAQFRRGLHPKLGYDIVRTGAPGDEDLEGWYTRSMEMARAFQDAKRYYGDQSGKKDTRCRPSQYKPKENVATSSSKREETPELPKVKGELTEVKMER